ncbi:Aldose 1-epimerase [Arenibacter nanhaiticus]|uniref:Aldose 1-epimerase n=1 Tax=Arenibacter nanhaiticus TaxID=558155 RepID=A0A1M6LGF9_9FLAO|nr:aldose 1-epimerase [Arenibacter nanhaiticus]SHJ70277.1 Aldose 1-epimerase [Arenibacter nanhaiticus]
MISLKGLNQTARIDAGELVGYTVDGHEYIHQKGSPGWRSSDTEMFPIIGPTNEADFKVSTPKGAAVQDQHGLLRELQYQLVSQTEEKAVWEKTYVANTKVQNSKYPAKSTEELLAWPYNFRFQKSYELTEEGLKITFAVSGDQEMPFMLGYHPAFKLHTDTPSVRVKDKSIDLPQILAVGNRALAVLDTEEVTLSDAEELHIKTEGFGNFMLWTEVPNMLCIEPISFYPYAASHENLHTGFQTLTEKEKLFSVYLQPNKLKK